MKIDKFTDNANKPILALDFDGTVTVENHFPHFAPLRKYIREVTHALAHYGTIIIIWTCRDKGNGHDHITPMEQFLNDNNITYHGVNSCIEYAPFMYEARKVYAHMYVDDRGFGWYESDDILLNVMAEFMYKYLGMESHAINEIRLAIAGGYYVCN